MQVYDATSPEPMPSTSYYSALLDTVPPERLSIPVITHAILEQVARNAQVSPLPGLGCRGPVGAFSLLPQLHGLGCEQERLIQPRFRCAVPLRARL
jgi:hypothetical protein